MGRPRAFDRDQAVDVAMNTIWQHGYAASSVNALAERMGITRSSFYHTFGDREALFREALARYLAAAPDRGFADIADGAPVVPAIRETFREICRVRAADPDARGCLLLNCLSELSGSDSELADVLAARVHAGIAHLEGLLQRAAAQGEIADAVDMHAKALALQNLVIGLNAMSKVLRDESELWSIAGQTLDGLGLTS